MNMRKNFLRMCSMILTIAMLINLLPTYVLATESQAENHTTSETSELPESKEDVYVLGEVVEKRTEFSKEFRLSNGLSMAAIYTDPIHYENNGEWEEIDNTLQLSNTRAGNVYTNTAGNWQVSFPQTLSQTSGVSITKDDHTLTFYMIGELRSPGGGGELSTMSANADSLETTYEMQTMQTATASVENLDLTALKEEAQYPEIVADKLSSRLRYDNIYANTDIVYDLNPGQVKESVIIEQYDKDLCGYSYILDVGDLVPVLTENNEITLFDNVSQAAVMNMPAPYLIDSAGEYSYEVSVGLKRNDDGYILTYILPQDWLADENRQWPVTLDPVVSEIAQNTNAVDQTVYEVSTIYTAHTAIVMTCGYDSSCGAMRCYVKYTNLPALTSADVIVDAKITLFVTEEAGDAIPVELHKVTSNWDASQITWNSQPTVETNITDYSICDGAQAWHSWDITDMVRGWYTGDNFGMLFKASDAVEESTTSKWKRFYSADFTAAEQPVVTIVFRNNNGLESYWDYTSASAGRAGTGYINNYTGNLVWVRNDIGFDGNRMPVSISHVYNANDSQNNIFGLGSGWRTNYNQRVYYYYSEADATSYYVWEDADGTAHYFVRESAGKYKDEDGLELTLTTTGSDTKKYSITDKYGNASHFDTNGRLTELTNNQSTNSSIIIEYTATTGKRIASITDGAGRVYQFTYSGSLLSKISFMGTKNEEITYVNFGYSGTKLTSITDKDGGISTYSYSSNTATINNTSVTNYLLTSAEDIDGYKLTYTYNIGTPGRPNRISSVTETDGGKQGGSLTIEYAQNQTTFTDQSGNVQIHQFNNWGNTISIQDGQGHAQYIQHAINDPDEQVSDDTAKGNQLRLVSKLQNTVGNVLSDSSFENGTLWGRSHGDRLSREISTTESYLGNKSLAMIHTGDGVESCLISPSFTVAAGETYTFSAYVKSGQGNAYLCMSDGSIWPKSEILPAGSDWTRLQVNYTNTGSTAKTVTARFQTSEPGTSYIDCVQVEKAPTASRYNLVQNGDFGTTTFWSASAGRTTAGTSAPAVELDSYQYKMTGSPTATNRISQTIPVSGAAGDSFVLAGWAMGDSASLDIAGREFSLIATFNYTDNTTSSKTIRFNPYVTNWQYAADFIEAGKAYSSIKIELSYDYNVNTVYFDGIQLFKEEFGIQYKYDPNGNIASATDIQGNKITYEYDDKYINLETITEIVNGQERVTSYEYDEWHNVTEMRTPDSLVYTYEYDEYGNNETVSITDGTSTIVTHTGYTQDGNQIASVTDTTGQTTGYAYNTDTGLLASVQYPNDTTSTLTTYSYDADNMFRLMNVASTTDRGSALTVSYAYENDLLRSITTGSTTYTFTYGDFALLQNVKAGSHTLASYEYTDTTHYLETLEYGNENVVEYTYDEQGKLTQEVYKDANGVVDSTVTYKYDNSNYLASVADSATGITTKYYYDLIGRMMKYTESGTNYSHIVVYTYDANDNLSLLTEHVGDTQYTSTYTYDLDNRVTSVNVKIGGSAVSGKNYTYDDLTRISTRTTTNGATAVMTEAIQYVAPNVSNFEGTTSGRIESITVKKQNSETVLFNYAYAYDGNGNITEVSSGGKTTTYEYDSANQLIRENNEASGKTWVWEYDNAGNITCRKEYSYISAATSTDELGNAVETIDYMYEDENWDDLLIQYGDLTIEYDEIGNPIKVKDSQKNIIRSYTWTRGRQLESTVYVEENKEITVSYTYNANGIRIGKTVTTREYAAEESTTYTVTFVADGVTVDTLTVDSGYTLTTSDYPEVPAKSGYTGAWNEYTSPITSNITIQAVYTAIESEATTHTVTFKVSYGSSSFSTTVKTMTVEDGYVLTDADYPTSSSSYYSYNWELYTSPITSDITVNGTYGTSSSTTTYTVTFVADGTTVDTLTVNRGYTLANSDYPDVPAKSGYTGVWDTYTSPIYSNITIEAVYTEDSSGSGSETDTHTVTFRVSYSSSSYGITVKTMTVADGYVLTDADYPTSSSSYYSYTWNTYTSPITSDITITGTYSYSWGASAESVATMTLNSDSTTLVSTTVEEHQYIYNGGSLTQEVITTTVDGGTATTETLFYAYDASGTPMSVTYNGTTYYYVTNLQGDVTAILKSDGTAVVTYAYDAWGKILPTDETTNEALGGANSLRYRGYVYDTESRFYYLQSRYYDPELGRFINADAYVTTGQGLVGNNMFAYCNNNPVNCKDPNGQDPVTATITVTAAGAVTVVILVAGVAVASYCVVKALWEIGGWIADLIQTAWTAQTSYAEAEEETLPRQGLVEGDPEAPPVDAGKQGKHVPGHNNHNKEKSSWPEGKNGVSQTQEAWQNGVPDPKVPSGKVKIGIASDGTVVRVHIDGKNAIHGYPLYP